MANAVALVQGASRGLGLSFSKLLSQRSNYNVVATCRNPDQAEELRGLPGVDVLRVDVTKETDIKAVADHVKEKYGKVDLLINSAGLLHPSGKKNQLLSIS